MSIKHRWWFPRSWGQLLELVAITLVGIAIVTAIACLIVGCCGRDTRGQCASGHALEAAPAQRPLHYVPGPEEP